jgi:hypothetical protein
MSPKCIGVCDVTSYVTPTMSSLSRFYIGQKSTFRGYLAEVEDLQEEDLDDPKHKWKHLICTWRLDIVERVCPCKLARTSPQDSYLLMLLKN